MLSDGADDWALCKADREAAYKQLPIDPDDQRNAIVALRRPTARKWRGSAAPTLIFGSVAAVLRYNVMSRIPASLTNRCLGMPLVAYFGDT